MSYVQRWAAMVFLICGITHAQSPAGFALSLDGLGGYADFGNAEEANFGTSDFTIELWMNKSSTRIEAVIGKREICGHHSFWNSRIAERINLEIDEDPSGDNRFSFSGVENVADSNWHHIAITREDSVIRFYHAAVLDSAATDSNGIMFLSNQASLLIGNNPCVGIDGTFYFTGLIDEVRLWSRARSASQLQSTMTDTLGTHYYTSADSGLIGYWRLDELEDLGVNGDGADDVRDHSIFGNHGDLVGGATLVPSGAMVGIRDNQGSIPRQFILHQNYPNPFNPSTNVEFGIWNTEWVTLKIYDVSGRHVATLVNRRMAAGNYSVKWDGSSAAGNPVASGIYLYRITAGEFTQTRQMLLLR